ncbi:hypothetical protein ACFWXO_35420 [Kitasatospora sp. NPDC059088]|uniref:hypothetical protein n=1 Tax=Kitasatospora sp. NPDC059088 TaxID=3346722 RepID=UPI0036BECEEF
MTGRTPPLGDTGGLWRAVLAAAAGRCQCRGTCGKSHAKDRGRCPALHGGYGHRHGTGPIRLAAAPAEPADLTLPPHRAAALPKTSLAAWCPACLDATTRAARAAHLDAAPSAEPDALF